MGWGGSSRKMTAITANFHSVIDAEDKAATRPTGLIHSDSCVLTARISVRTRKRDEDANTAAN